MHRLSRVSTTSAWAFADATALNPAADPKVIAAKPPAAWKGPHWTTDVAAMNAPARPAAGWIMGGDFKVEEATFTPIGGASRSGRANNSSRGLLDSPLGFQKTLASLEGKTIIVHGKQQGGRGLIFAHLGRTPQGESPKMETFMEYTMKLQFGKGEGFKLPGVIYICLPDKAKSVIAGKFVLESK